MTEINRRKLMTGAAATAAFSVLAPILCATLRYQASRSPFTPPLSALSHTPARVVACANVHEAPSLAAVASSVPVTLPCDSNAAARYSGPLL